MGVLELLPSSMDVMHLQKYINKILPYLVHKRRTTQIKKNLHKRLYLRQQAYLAATKSRVVRMDYASHCSKCGKSIGSSFFILDPKTFRKYHHSCFYKKRAPKNPNIITDEHRMVMDEEDLDTPTIVPSYHDHLNNPFGVEKSTTNPFEALVEETNPFGKIRPQRNVLSTNPFENSTNPFS